MPVDGGGVLLHILSDQQWVLHWLVFVSPDGGGGPVVVTSVPFGFTVGRGQPPAVSTRGSPIRSYRTCLRSAPTPSMSS